MMILMISNHPEAKQKVGKCQNSGQGQMTEGRSPHSSHKKAKKCAHSWLILEGVSPL